MSEPNESVATKTYPLSILDGLNDTTEPRTVKNCAPVIFHGRTKAVGVLVEFEDGGEVCLKFRNDQELCGLIAAAEVAKRRKL